MLSLQGWPCQKRGGEESLVQELLGHHQEDEKGDVSRQKKRARKVRGDACLHGFLLIKPLSRVGGGGRRGGEQDS